MASKYNRPISTNHESVNVDDMNDFNTDEDKVRQNTVPQIDEGVLMEKK